MCLTLKQQLCEIEEKTYQELSHLTFENENYINETALYKIFYISLKIFFILRVILIINRE